jgi:hypothetical protein
VSLPFIKYQGEKGVASKAMRFGFFGFVIAAIGVAFGFIVSYRAGNPLSHEPTPYGRERRTPVNLLAD